MATIVVAGGGLVGNCAAMLLAADGRRPMVEAAIERVAARTPGGTVRRGVAVRGLLAGGGNGATPDVVAPESRKLGQHA